MTAAELKQVLLAYGRREARLALEQAHPSGATFCEATLLWDGLPLSQPGSPRWAEPARPSFLTTLLQGLVITQSNLKDEWLLIGPTLVDTIQAEVSFRFKPVDIGGSFICIGTLADTCIRVYFSQALEDRWRPTVHPEHHYREATWLCGHGLHYTVGRAVNIPRPSTECPQPAWTLAGWLARV